MSRQIVDTDVLYAVVKFISYRHEYGKVSDIHSFLLCHKFINADNPRSKIQF